ncbi:MAG: hypothetical protein HFG45_00040 [Oscillospiraceae bacterium]|jgi:hypothetical protein|nr:hypothetical protein [Oscillospiraceae bacterium]
MRKLQCVDCGCELEPWDVVYDWPGVGEVCENCMESRVYEMRAAEAAERMGIVPRMVGDG